MKSTTGEAEGRDQGGVDATVVIAEIGINHNGDLELAKRLVREAKRAGADAVKFQKRTPELCVPPEEKPRLRDTPWGRISYLDYRRRMEFGRREFDAIDALCRELEIEWFASVWDLPSLEFMLGYEPRHLKIPSAMLTHRRLLECTAETRIPTYLSCGMSDLTQIDEAVGVFRKAGCVLTLMHCNSSYPAQNEELNLECIRTLRDRYSCPVGYSGHEFGLVPTLIAVALGATCVERHFTMDRTLYGSDQQSSVEPKGLVKLVNFIRTVEAVRGDGIKRVYESELPAMQKLRYISPVEAGAARNPKTRRPEDEGRDLVHSL